MNHQRVDVEKEELLHDLFPEIWKWSGQQPWTGNGKLHTPPIYHRLELRLELQLVDIGVCDNGEHDLYDESAGATRTAAPSAEILDL